MAADSSSMAGCSLAAPPGLQAEDALARRQRDRQSSRSPKPTTSSIALLGHKRIESPRSRSQSADWLTKPGHTSLVLSHSITSISQLASGDEPTAAVTTPVAATNGGRSQRSRAKSGRRKMPIVVPLLRLAPLCDDADNNADHDVAPATASSPANAALASPKRARSQSDNSPRPNATASSSTAADEPASPRQRSVSTNPSLSAILSPRHSKPRRRRSKSPKKAPSSSQSPSSSTTLRPAFWLSPSSSSSSSSSTSSSSSAAAAAGFSSSGCVESVRRVLVELRQPVVLESLLREIGSRPPDQAVQLSAALCVLLENCRLFAALMQELGRREAETTREDNTFLRGETPVTLLISGFLHAYGSPQLPHFFKKALAPLDKSSRKMATLATPMGQVWLFRRIVDAVSRTANDMVLPVLRLLRLLAGLRHHQQQRSEPAAFADIVRSVYILRFVCPYLVTRSMSLSLRHVDRAASADIRKGYLVCVKMLQCMASCTELAIQLDNRDALNAAVQSSMDKYDEAVQQAFVLVASLPSTDRLSSPMKSLSGYQLSVNTKEHMELVVQLLRFCASEVDGEQCAKLADAAKEMSPYSARRLAVELALV